MVLLSGSHTRRTILSALSQFNDDLLGLAFPLMFPIRSHTNKRLSILHLPPLYNRLVFLTVSFIIKCLYRYNSIPTTFLPVPNTRKTETLLFKHQYSRTNCLKFSSFIFFPRIYESLPRDLRDLCLEPSYKPFINSLRDHLYSYSPISNAY